MGLAGRDGERDRIAEGVDEGVDLGRQSTAGAPEGLVLTPFLRAPALCW
jgi:hypothetical protein